MMSMGMCTFFSLGYRKISSHGIRVSFRKTSFLRMCVQTGITGKTGFLVKYPNQIEFRLEYSNQDTT